MRVLIAIESCFAHRHLHKAQEETWLKDVVVTDYRFFLGRNPPAAVLRVNEVSLDVDDSYETLPQKTQAICRWALEHKFDFLFKCDVDTVLNPWQFVLSGFQGLDYLGGENEDDSPYGRIQFASGGAGYWLSKKALTIVTKARKISTTAEDVFVAAALREAGILPGWHSGYRWRPNEKVDKEMITLHLSSALQRKYVPEMMYEYYEKVRAL
jgi:hypothetical protein